MADNQIIYSPLVVGKLAFVSYFYRVDGRVGLVILVTNFRVNIFIGLSHQFLSILSELCRAPYPFNQLSDINGFGECIGLGPRVRNQALLIQLLGYLHCLCRRHPQLIGNKFLKLDSGQGIGSIFLLRRTFSLFDLRLDFSVWKL